MWQHIDSVKGSHIIEIRIKTPAPSTSLAIKYNDNNVSVLRPSSGTYKQTSWAQIKC